MTKDNKIEILRKKSEKELLESIAYDIDSINDRLHTIILILMIPIILAVAYILAVTFTAISKAF